MRIRRCAGQSGYATVWALSWMAACLTLGWVAIASAAVVAEQHAVDGAADLSALAAAADVQSGGDGCSVAATTASANAVRLVRCSVGGTDVSVEVVADVAVPMTLTMRAVARAGPSEVTGD